MSQGPREKRVRLLLQSMNGEAETTHDFIMPSTLADYLLDTAPPSDPSVKLAHRTASIV